MATLSGSTGDEDLDMEGRASLVEQSLAQLQAAYDQALRDEVRQPVIFLIDCEDPLGSQLARQWEGDDAVDGAILANTGQAASGSDEETFTTTLVRALPFGECQREVPQLFPYLNGSFAQPPHDGFLVVVISYGGAATFTAPFRQGRFSR
ncbi:MAG: hypothetical protein GTO53_12530 [Planctomycetales bacterium]|nr:hypothetical protein [Planctomycetales bacterium]NIN09370.1 hypothetical protein [Planctomycetales bacterium]NIN78477.1 hypothetical protein [Planctomycetales bacterium]NIO35668.1 hypothetical protein [Planctomycetales bacterium]NIO47415.1 hypothetical protein [Planctomycetales bacterium]